ncbi:MAG: response regulator [Rhodospirillales bacterium]|nr:response regulator [Rhodospirillales bacterium]
MKSLNYYNLEKLNFLIVEDNQFELHVLKQVLNSLGIKRIKEAGDGAEALAVLKTGYFPDIIITDWLMPVLDGMELIRLIRKGTDVVDPHVPIIMVTAHSEQSRILAARDAGATEILIKPYSATDLYRRFVAIIDRPRDFVKAKTFAGPDRRRRSNGGFKGEDRRQNRGTDADRRKLPSEA